MKKEKIQYKINFKDSRHGEEFFIANQRSIISPCFFIKNQLNEFITYGLRSKEEPGICITNRKQKDHNLEDMKKIILNNMK